jgi:hypothetical protein
LNSTTGVAVPGRGTGGLRSGAPQKVSALVTDLDGIQAGRAPETVHARPKVMEKVMRIDATWRKGKRCQMLVA